MGFFDSTNENSTHNTLTDINTTNNLDYTLTQTSNYDNKQTSITKDSFNTAYTQNTDSSVRALDSFNKNLNYQLANVGNIIAGDGAADAFKGMGLDLGSFFSANPVPFSAGANRDIDAGAFLNGSTVPGGAAAGSLPYMKYLFYAALAFSAWLLWKKFRKK